MHLNLIASAAICAGLTLSPAYADPRDDVVNILNETRKSKGRPALVVSAKLQAAAQAHADDMATQGYFSHTGKNGSTVGKRIKRQGYKFCWAAENIAWGQKSATQVMQSWQDSAGHRKNNLSRKPTQVGAGGRGKYWVLVFAKPC